MIRPAPANFASSSPLRLAATLLSLLGLLLASFAFEGSAHAAGNLRVKNTTINEQSGAWRIIIPVLELPKKPALGRVPMRFFFQQTAVFERSLVDGKSEPVQTRANITNGKERMETLDVDFSDTSGKIWSRTSYDFGLSRDSGYEAGEYIMRVRTADGVDVGGKITLTLKGDNAVVDRRTMAFNAKEPNIKKVDGVATQGPPKTDDDTPAADVQGDVQASGTAEPFISPDGYEETDEENLKVKRGGCGCSLPGLPMQAGGGAAVAALALATLLRRRTRRSDTHP